MKYIVEITKSADIDLKCYTVFEQKIIINGMLKYLQFDAEIESGRRKKLRSNQLSP